MEKFVITDESYAKWLPKLCLNLPASQIIHSMNLSPRGIGICTTFLFKIIIFDELKKPSMDKDLLESLRRSLGLVYFDENAT